MQKYRVRPRPAHKLCKVFFGPCRGGRVPKFRCRDGTGSGSFILFWAITPCKHIKMIYSVHLHEVTTYLNIILIGLLPSVVFKYVHNILLSYLHRWKPRITFRRFMRGLFFLWVTKQRFGHESSIEFPIKYQKELYTNCTLTCGRNFIKYS